MVDLGDTLFWYNTDIPQYRAGIAGVTREKLSEGEYLNGHPFSMDIPLSPVTGDYNLRGNNTRFYGGMKTHCWDNSTNKYTWSEGGNNVDHESFDDFTYMGFALESLHTPEQPGNRLAATGVWLWKKEDFLNDGDKYPVTFDETSRVGVYLSLTYPVNQEHAARLIAEGKVPSGTKPFNDTYANQCLETVPREHWKGWETVHLVVRDREHFWVAEPAFEPVKQTLIEVSPTKVRWANYGPKGPWNFDFDHTKATFEAHTFTDVTAVGWMIVKNAPTNAGLWCNALSELKGLKLVYYSDNALSQSLKSANPFRTISRQWTLQSNRFGVTPRPFKKFLFHVDPSADGFRLPTSTEWTALANGGKYTSGNVFEWTIEPLKDPKPNHHFSVAAHGGSFRSDTKTPGSPLGTAPSRGAWEWIASGWTSPEIGFRIVKRAP